MNSPSIRNERKHPMRRTISFVAAAALVAVVAVGCSERMQAERDGRDLADAICDLRGASSADAAKSAIADINKQIDDLGKNYGSATAEDRRDIEENLSDLTKHVASGNETLIEQDLAVLKRSVQNVRDDSSNVQDSAWNGFAEGLQECATD
jgi:polyhydroxyalkanoate synthesis regulator phasin